jgi:hypothetical protein
VAGIDRSRALTTGRVLIAGGSWGDLGSSSTAEIYDPVTGAFSATDEMTAGINAYGVLPCSFPTVAC